MKIRVPDILLMTLFGMNTAGLTTVSMMDATSHNGMHEHTCRSEQRCQGLQHSDAQDATKV